jgi:hypothetical protein
MCLPLIAVLALHFLLYHRDWLKRNPWRVALSLTVAALVASPYLVHLAQNHPVESHSWRSRVASLGFSLSGPVQLSAIGFERYLGRNWFLPVSAGGIGDGPLTALVVLSALAYLFCWYGLILAGRGWWRHEGSGLHYDLCFVAFLGFVFHLALNFLMGLFSYGHYYNGVWIFFFVFLWLAVSQLWDRGWARGIFLTYAIAMAFTLVTIATLIHQRGGSRELAYGPTLDNLITVAEELNAYQPGAHFVSEARHPSIFPETITVLQRLYSPEAPPSLVALPPLTLRYRKIEDPHDGRIEIAPTPRFHTPTVLR